jgi:hypothetical protein
VRFGLEPGAGIRGASTSAGLARRRNFMFAEHESACEKRGGCKASAGCVVLDFDVKTYRLLSERWSSVVAARRPAAPLGVRWSLVDVCGSGFYLGNFFSAAAMSSGVALPTLQRRSLLNGL